MAVVGFFDQQEQWMNVDNEKTILVGILYDKEDSIDDSGLMKGMGRTKKMTNWGQVWKKAKASDLSA